MTWRNWLLLAYTAVGYLHSVAQIDSLRIRRDIDTLCSVAYAGRGYVRGGQERAAAYIEKQFQALATSPQDVLVQSFGFDLNVPQSASLVVGKKSYKIGRDFIIHRLSGSGEAYGRIVDAGFGLTPEKSWRGRVVLLRAGLPDSVQQSTELRQKYRALTDMNVRIAAALQEQPVAIIILQTKITAAFSREQAGIPIVEATLPMTENYANKRIRLQVNAQMQRIVAKNIALILHPTNFADTAVKQHTIYITAHYDHLGMQGDALFAGANDNASGTSMLLETARHFAVQERTTEMRFVAFAAEECGLLGSKAWADAHASEFPSIRFLLNLDLMGNGDKGITAVAGKDFPQYFERLSAQNARLHAVPQVKARANAPNSDHYWFAQAGVPSFFVYTEGGPPHYHDINDLPQNLPLSRYRAVFGLLVAFLNEIQATND